MIPTLASAVALALALILLQAVASAVRKPDGLVATIETYQVLPGGSGRYLAPLLVLAELCAAVLLAVPATRSAGAITSLALLSAFTIAIALNVLRGTTDFDCGCGGPFSLRPGPALLVRNVLLLIGCLFVLVVPARDVEVMQCALAVILLLAWWIADGIIAAAQWPTDD